MTLHELQKRLTTFDITTEVIETIRDTQEDIVKLNQGQLFVGNTAEDKPILSLKTHRHDYSAFWGDIRLKYNLQVDHFDLRFTGKFWSSIHVADITRDTFKLISDDTKYLSLELMFGEKILGLSPASKSEEYLPLYFRPTLFEKIHYKLGI